MSTTTAQAAQQASTPSFESALVYNAAVFGVELLIFTVVRKHFRSVYEPRTYVPEPSKRSPELSASLLGWPLAIWRADPARIQHVNGIDAYMFVRFLRMMYRMLLPIWTISWVVLMPVYAVNTNASPAKSGLDLFTFGNVASDMQGRYVAPLVVMHSPLVLAWVFTVWILYTIRKEMSDYIVVRQKYLISKAHSATAQASTVLITGVPRKFLDETLLAALFRHLPGGVKKVWLNRDLKEMPKLHDRRLDACNKLESAENALLETALKLKRKQEQAAAKSGSQPTEKADPEASTSLADRLVPRQKRPTRRLPWRFLPISLPFIGEKVDTIEWARQEIAETSAALQVCRAQLEKDIKTEGSGKAETYPPLNSAFIWFNQQIGAHLAAQSLLHNEPYRMSMKHIEMAPADVIWSNLGMNPYDMKIRGAISLAFSIGLIISWSLPVAFFGALSNVNHLCSFSWLSWICRLPSAVVGIISGVLPPLGLAILMMLLPIVLRLLGRFEGIPRYSGLELSLMSRYFLFLVVHGFLITTLSSGLIAALPSLIADPESIPQILGKELPMASTFFLTYVILQGMSGGGSGLLQAVPLVIHYVKLFVLGSTPRSIYNIKYVMRSVAWGTLVPSMTLLAVITIAYSVISPIINGLACFSFFIFYQVYKYLFLWQMDQPAAGDTGGLYFPMAINHIFVGLYIEQICLTALFLLSSTGTPTAIPEAIFMIVLIVITAGFHAILNNSYGPLLHALPLSLAHRSYGMPVIEGDRRMDDTDADSIRPLNPTGKEDPSSDLGNDHSNPEAAARAADADVAFVSGAQEQTVNKETNGGESAVVHEEGKHSGFDKAIDGPTDFNHPATVEPQRVIWIAQDPLGLGDSEIVTLHQIGVDASNHDASMDEKGHVEIFGIPPGQAAVDSQRDT